jgi:hypothetical protein
MAMRKLIGCAVLPCAALLGACAAPAPPVSACTSLLEQAQGAAPPAIAASVRSLEYGLSGRVAAADLGTTRTAAGTVAVTYRLTNCTAGPLQIEARTHFLDAQGAPTEGPSGWRRVFLPSFGTDTYQESSADVRAVASYYIEMRAGR